MLSLCTTTFFAQNLVPNYSFEQQISCPNGSGGISLGLATFWGGFDSADYFSFCSTDSQYSAPHNIAGYQQALNDSSYAGIGLYVATNTTFSSEFIQVQLIDSLDKSHYYCVSFYISLADSSNYAVRNLGAYFSEDAITLSDIENNAYVPQIENPVDSMLNDKVNWKKTSGYYYASGGEQFLTIGNFYNNANTVSQHLGGATSPFYDAAYYYIDDVSVVQCDSLFTSVNNNTALSKAIKPIRLYPNPNDGNMILDYALLPFEKGEIIFYDIAGKAIRSCNFNNSTSEIAVDVSMLNAGVYLYDVFINNTTVKTDKIIIAK